MSTRDGDSSVDPGAVWRYPWLPLPHNSTWEHTAGGMCLRCATCPLPCLLNVDPEVRPYIGCYSPSIDCCDEPVCQGLPQGFDFVAFAAVVATLLAGTHLLVLGLAHGMRYKCCSQPSSCSVHCCIASPLLFLGTLILLFDWLTDANFYATLSYREKADPRGYACLGCLCISAVLIVSKVTLESSSCRLFHAEYELQEANRTHRIERRLKPWWMRGSGFANAAPSGEAGAYLRRQATLRHCETTVLEARAVALRLRSWHWTSRARLCVAILLLEDLPELMLMWMLGRLNFVAQSSRVSLIGVGVSASWAFLQLYRGKRAGRIARDVKLEIEPAREQVRELTTFAMADEIFHGAPASSAPADANTYPSLERPAEGDLEASSSTGTPRRHEDSPRGPSTCWLRGARRSLAVPALPATVFASALSGLAEDDPLPAAAAAPSTARSV